MTLIRADARLVPLRDGCVQCVVTSPPYFGLRDYGTARWEGGDPDCDHKQGRNGSGRADGIVDERGQRNRDGCGAMGGDCQKCGARRIDAQIGLEPTPEAYVAELVAVFREVRRVLRDDGVLFLNLGDSYATGAGSGRSMGGDCFGKQNVVIDGAAYPVCQPNRMPLPGLKPKDLIGIPWRVAFALQADGWYLRSDIIWAKPNPMPESVTDRPTKSHEYVFLLTKAARYFWDAEAVAEPATKPPQCMLASPVTARLRSTGPMARGEEGFNHQYADRERVWAEDGTRNVRSVWSIATQPYPEAHFATFPEALAERCLKAGSRPGDLVFDPFGGSGTVAQVARRLNRRAVCTELNAAYLALAKRRISEQQVSLWEVSA